MATTWYTKETYTPANVDGDRRREYGEFQFPEGSDAKELAIAGMLSVGWSEELAKSIIKRDVEEVEMLAGGGISFVVFGQAGEYDITIRKEPFEKV